MKINRNSLFSILLRSPWWVSIAIAIVVTAIAKLALPPAYWLFGACAALPFLVIGCVVARRQWRAPSASQIERNLEIARTMSWQEFAQAMEQSLGRDGAQVERLASGPADFLVSRKGRTALVACKRWKAGSHGIEPLRDLHKAMLARDASEAIYVSLAPVSDNAQKFAQENQVVLLQGEELAGVLGRLDALAPQPR